MIIDLDGAAPEPGRRRHVMALSGAAAAVALVILAVLFVPAPERGIPPGGAVPVPSPTAASVTMTIASGQWVSFDQAAQFRDRDDVTTSCVAGTGPTPSMTIVFDGNGQPIAAYTGGPTGRFIPLRPEYWGPFSITVPCDTSDVFAPRINRAR